MKKIFLLFFLIPYYFANAQIQYGIKAGVNFESFGEIDFNNLSSESFNGNSQTGFHLGLYTTLKLSPFYLRPEFQFSYSVANYQEYGEIKINKVEVPILIGYKILKPLSVFAGPSFQYIISKKGLSLGEIEKKYTVGLQIGTNLELGRFGIGVRFERGFTDNEITILGDNNIDVIGRVDARPKQWVISLSYSLNRNKGKKS